MHKSLRLLACVVVVFAACLASVSADDSRFIINGDLANASELKFTVAIYERLTRKTAKSLDLSPKDKPQGQVCTGSLIAPNMVLTAGHCPHKRGAIIRVHGLSPTHVNFVDKDDNEYHIRKAYRHKGYRRFPKRSSDMMILLLNKKVVGVEPAVMSLEKLPVGEKVTMAGYGLLKPDGSGPDTTTLRKIEMEVISSDLCMKKVKNYWLMMGWFEDPTPERLKNYVSDDVQCAAASEGDGTKSACNGDSGGPVVHGGKLAGVMSRSDCETFTTYHPIRAFHDSWIVPTMAKAQKFFEKRVEE